MTNRDTALGIAFAALGVVALIGTAQMKPGILNMGRVSSVDRRRWPIVFGLALAITSLHSSSADPAAEHSVICPRTLPLFLAYLLAPFVYILVAPTLGFLLTMSAIIATSFGSPTPARYAHWQPALGSLSSISFLCSCCACRSPGASLSRWRVS